MNEQKPAAKSGSSALIIRIAVYGILAVFAIVAVMEYMVKRNFDTSVQAMQLEKPLSESVEAFVGSYEEGDGKKEGRFAVKFYTWKGLFREYKMKVRCDGNPPAVYSFTTKKDEIDSE